MGILRALYLKQNIGGNVDIFLQSKGTVTSIVVVCRPCSRKWRILVNIGDFEGLAFGIYLSVMRKTREEIFSEPLQRQAEIHPEIRIAPQSARLRLAHENLLRII